MSTPERIVVVSTNARYAAPAAVSVRSAITDASEGVSVVLLYFGSESEIEFQIFLSISNIISIYNIS